MSCTDEAGFKSVSVEEFDSAISDTTVQRLDVRTPEEFASGHISRSINIDVLADSFDIKALSALDKSRPVAVYCRSGRRSKQAASVLVDKGFTVVELSTGFNGWTEAGKDVE